MKCEDARALIALRAGGDLPDRDGERLTAHVENCADCRKVGGEVAEGLAWAKAAAAPRLSEAEHGEIRREVWRRIEAGGAKAGSLLPGRLVLAAAGLFAAVLAAVFLARRAPQQSPVTVAARPSAAAVVPAAPSPAAVEATSAPAARIPATSFVEVAASIPPHRARRRPPAVSGESTVERIEFRTANPNVRIIWLVKKGEEKSSSRAAGRFEEVS